MVNQNNTVFTNVAYRTSCGFSKTKKCIRSANQSMLFSLIASSILRSNDLFQQLDSKVLQWTLIEDFIVGFFNNKLYLRASTMEFHDNCNNRTLPTIRVSDSMTRKIDLRWCFDQSEKRESPRFRHSRALLVTRHCSRCDVTTWRRLQLSLPGWLMREVLLRRLSCRGPWHRFFQAPFLITVRILHSVSASSLTVLLARSCVSFDQ